MLSFVESLRLQHIAFELDSKIVARQCKKSLSANNFELGLLVYEHRISMA